MPELQKFMVLKRVEVPKAEYHYDAAVNLIIELNEIYNPSWIYCDAGGGEMQIERLHIYGEEHPESGLKHKVVRRNFRQTLEIQDPITHEIDKKPLKLFMVNQLQIAFQRDLIVLSPFDEIIHKQLIDYQVEKFTGVTHDPIFTSKNEHFVDALGLAYLAFVLEFNELIDMVRDTTVHTIAQSMRTSFAKKSLGDLYEHADQYAPEQVWHTNNKMPLSDPFKDEPFTKERIPMPLTNHMRRPNISSYNPYGSRRGSGGRSNRIRRSW